MTFLEGSTSKDSTSQALDLLPPQQQLQKQQQQQEQQKQQQQQPSQENFSDLLQDLSLSLSNSDTQKQPQPTEQQTAFDLLQPLQQQPETVVGKEQTIVEDATPNIGQELLFGLDAFVPQEQEQQPQQPLLITGDFQQSTNEQLKQQQNNLFDLLGPEVGCTMYIRYCQIIYIYFYLNHVKIMILKKA